MEIETIAQGRKSFGIPPSNSSVIVSFPLFVLLCLPFFLGKLSLVSSWFGLVSSHTIENSIDLQNEVYWLGRQILFIYFHLQFYERLPFVPFFFSSWLKAKLLAIFHSSFLGLEVLEGFSLQFGAKITLRPRRIVAADVFVGFRFGCAESSVCL